MSNEPSEAVRSPRYLRPEDVRQLRAMAFSPRMMVEGALTGKHRSRQRGASTEFHEFRAYAPGDPPGMVDWRAFARSDRLYLRTYELETHLECHLFLDSSGSMDFRDDGPSKLEWASHFAACLAYLVTLRQDRISMTLFDRKPREFLPPGSTQGHLRQLLNLLETNQARGETGLAQALDLSLPLLKRRGTVIVISDFLTEPAETFRAISAYTHRGFRVFLFQVLTREELELPGDAPRRYVDLESSRSLVAHPASVRAAYREEIAAHQSALRHFSLQRGIELVQAVTDQPWIAHLRHLTFQTA